MATYTTNYNLEKPAQTDIYNVDVFNDNADKIDAGLTDKAEKTMLAPVETTNSASRSYAKGEYFVYNNVLCCATTAIAAGGTIAIGTNCSTAPVGGELKSLRDALSQLLLPLSGWHQSVTVHCENPTSGNTLAFLLYDGAILGIAYAGGTLRVSNMWKSDHGASDTITVTAVNTSTLTIAWGSAFASQVLLIPVCGKWTIA